MEESRRGLVYDLARKYRLSRDEGKRIADNPWVSECFMWNDKLVYCFPGEDLYRKVHIILPQKFETNGYIELRRGKDAVEYKLIYFHPLKNCICAERVGDKEELLEELLEEKRMKFGVSHKFLDGEIKLEKKTIFYDSLYYKDSDNERHLIADNVVNAIKLTDNILIYQSLKGLTRENLWSFRCLILSNSEISAPTGEFDIKIDDGKVQYSFIYEDNGSHKIIEVQDFFVNLVICKNGDFTELYNQECGEVF